MNKQTITAILLALTVSWITGCSTSSKTSSSDDNSASTTSSTSTTSTDSDAITYSTKSDVDVDDDDMADNELLKVKTFYFDFDKSTIKSEFLAALNAHAARLRKDRSLRVVLHGHADERGTREYNMALGERRAKAVQRYLVLQGVASSQIESVSYGEEKPVVKNPSSEAGHAKNRRVELN